MRRDVYFFNELLLFRVAFPIQREVANSLRGFALACQGQIISSSMSGVEMQPSYWLNTALSCGSMQNLPLDRRILMPTVWESVEIR